MAKTNKQRYEERKAEERRRWVSAISNHIINAREAGKFIGMPHDKKRWAVVDLTRFGLTNQQIAETTGFSLAFVNDAIRDFAHKALVTAVKESANASA